MQLKVIDNMQTEFFHKYNGLYLHEEDGFLTVFQTERQMYYYWLDWLREHFPSGYIEVLYYVSTYYGIAVNLINSQLKSANVRDKTRWIVYVNWPALDFSSTLVLLSLAQRLHKLFGTTFNKEECEIAIKTYYENHRAL